MDINTIMSNRTLIDKLLFLLVNKGTQDIKEAKSTKELKEIDKQYHKVFAGINRQIFKPTDENAEILMKDIMRLDK